jgi:large subunit ribosomal protein L24
MKRLKIGDPVIVIAGNEKGKEGTLQAVSSTKVIVKGLNKKKKHVKGDQNGRKGQIVEFEAPLNISNVAYCQEGKGYKLRARYNSEGKKEIYILLADKKDKVIRTI